MLTYSLVAVLLIGGAVRTEPVLEGFATYEDCQALAPFADRQMLSVPSDADHVPLVCEAQWEA